MFIAILSTLISSIALVGVAASLLLQSRQLRASQIQASRASQVELIKFALNNPALTKDFAEVGDPEDFVRAALYTWHFAHLSLTYAVGDVSKQRLQTLAFRLFSSEDARKWWAELGSSYKDGARSRSDKEFFVIVNREYERADLIAESAKSCDVAS
jgi:hypothetical protein